MRGIRRGWSFLWALVLVAATVSVIVGSSPARARAAVSACILGCGTTSSSSTSSSTSSTSSSTSSTTTAPPPTSTPPAYPAAFVPCGSTSGPCNQEPQQIRVDYATAGPAAALQLAWVSRGRASGAPAPASASVTLTWSDGSACGSGFWCWAWPPGMTDSSFVLNGTYQVAACGTEDNGACGAPSSPQDIQVAAPPGPPTQVTARVSDTQVAVSWRPPAAAPPDLAGYTVARNGADVYSCSLDGLGPGASVPCPGSLTFADHPGNGRYTYTVRSVRLGADTAADDTVPSTATPAAGGAVTVAAPAPAGGTGPSPGGGGDPGGGTGGTGGAGSLGGFTPSPVIGGAGAIGGSLGPDPGAASGQGLPGAPAQPGAPQNLQYPSDNPVVGKATPLALDVHGGPGRTDVVPAGILALGLLLLAIAAHFLYLRAELGAVQGRLAGARDQPE